MFKKVCPGQPANFEREDRTCDGHSKTVEYVTDFTV